MLTLLLTGTYKRQKTTDMKAGTSISVGKEHVYSGLTQTCI